MAEKIEKARQQRLGLQTGQRTGAKSEYKAFVPGPNPELPDFIKQHATPYDPKADKYDVKAFDRDLIVDKAAPPKAIYDMHTYWSKKHWASIREYIRHYLPKKYYPDGAGLVLDCFSGSGMTGVAAMMENRPCVLIDASPAAAFISHCYTHPVDPDELHAAYDRMMTEPYPADLKKKLKAATGEDIQTLQEELDWLYVTKCDRCGGDASTEYVVYSERFQCPKCGEVVALFDCPEAKVLYLVGSKAKPKSELKKRRVCPHCLKKHGEAHRDFVISTRTKKFGATPVLVTYNCNGECKPKRGVRSHQAISTSRSARFFKEHDLRRLDFLEGIEIPHSFPRRKMMDFDDDSRPWGVKWRSGTANFRSVADLYSKRNLWALAAWRATIRRSASNLSPLQISVTVPSITCSKMLREEKRAVQTGTYYNPQVSRHINLSNAVDYGLRVIAGGQRALWHIDSAAGVLVTNDVASTVASFNEQLDYIFTDPPYLNLEVQYGELNFVWEAWLDFSSDWLRAEITLNPIRQIGWEEAEARLRSAVAAIASALKPGRFASICYHDTSESNWKMIHDAVADAGLVIETVTTLEPKQKTFRMLTMEKVVRSDLVLNCRKPRLEETETIGNGAGVDRTSSRVRTILVEFLSTHGGQTRDRLWDVVLKRLLTRGQMAEHRFDDILAEVATRSESARWFLKEEFENLSENDLRNEEDAGRALERFARFRCVGVPVNLSAQLALSSGVQDDAHEDEVERYIKREVLGGQAGADFKLGGRMKGCEFYDCLFFYLTRYLKGRPAGRTPRRNLAEFLEEYLVRSRDGDKWLYRPPTGTEAASLKKSRQFGLGRRVRQFVAYLNGEGDFPKERIPDAKTLIAWLKHCANFGLAEAGVVLFEKGGLMGQLSQLGEDERYDAEDYYAQCRRNAGRKQEEEEEEEVEQENGEE